MVEKVELAQNLARENIQRSQQKMKEYYDRFLKSDKVLGFTRQKQRRVYQRSCCIIGLVHIELLSSRLPFITVCVLKVTRNLLSLFMLIE